MVCRSLSAFLPELGMSPSSWPIKAARLQSKVPAGEGGTRGPAFSSASLLTQPQDGLQPAEETANPGSSPTDWPWSLGLCQFLPHLPNLGLTVPGLWLLTPSPAQPSPNYSQSQSMHAQAIPETSLWLEDISIKKLSRWFWFHMVSHGPWVLLAVLFHLFKSARSKASRTRANTLTAIGKPFKQHYLTTTSNIFNSPCLVSW